LAAEPASVTQARQAVKKHLREVSVSDAQLDLAGLGVSEAVGNAVRHAYPDGAAGRVEVEVHTDPDHVHIHVRDWGCGSADDRAETAGAGWGIPLMQSLSQEFEISERLPHGTEVRMTLARG
jgi:anti-sigma regulatory factor (Ser/Thr protein kinase)